MALKLIKKIADEVADYAGPLLTDNVGDMSAEQIKMAVANADNLGLPRWRVVDLERQLPKTEDLERLQRIRQDADDRLTGISRVPSIGRSEDLPMAEEFKPIVDSLFDGIFDAPPPRSETFTAPERPSSLLDEINSVLGTSVSPRTGYAPDPLSQGVRRGARTAPWADAEEVSRFYDTAKQLEEITGVAYDVDHYIPLQGEYVSGLHHQDNLFAMPATQNRKKRNSFDYDKYREIPDSAFRLTSNPDHAAFLEENAALVRQRQGKKSAAAPSISRAVSEQMLDPKTKLGKSSRTLWGQDAEKYLQGIRKELGLLGV